MLFDYSGLCHFINIHMNSYELSRNWFDWCFDNPEKINTNHHAVFFFAIEHCNRLGWKDKFGFPSQMVMDAVGIKNWRTYSSTLNDLVDFGFIKMVEKSRNQYSSNIIAIVKNTKATSKALDKATSKHSTKQRQSIVSIDKPINNITIEQKESPQDVFLNWFNQRLLESKGKIGKYKVLKPTEINNLQKLKDAGYTIEDFFHAFKIMVSQEWVIQNGMDTPQHFLRNDNFQKYVNIQFSKSNEPEIDTYTKTIQKATGYTDAQLRGEIEP